MGIANAAAWQRRCFICTIAAHGVWVRPDGPKRTLHQPGCCCAHLATKPLSPTAKRLCAGAILYAKAITRSPHLSCAAGTGCCSLMKEK